MNKSHVIAAGAAMMLACLLTGGGAIAGAGKKNVKAPLYQIHKPDEYSTYGTYYPLCQEVVKIINLPENEDLRRKPMMKDFSDGGAFYIPLDRFKNFSLPTWEEIPKEQWLEYIGADMLADWERPAGPIVQMRKTMLDVDHDGNLDELIDFSSDPRALDQKFQNPSRQCTISNKAAPYMLDDDKGFRDPTDGWLSDCFPFSYKGRAYIVEDVGFFFIREFGHIDTPHGRRVSDTIVCNITRH